MLLSTIDTYVRENKIEKQDEIVLNDSVSIEVYNEINTIKILLRLVLKKDNKTIWGLYQTNYRNWGFYTEEHLFKEVDEDFRRNGYMQEMFNLFKKYDLLPKQEVSAKPSNILFLLKNWYKLHSYIIKNWMEIEEEFIDETNLEKHLNIIKANINQHWMERKLEDIYILKLK